MPPTAPVWCSCADDHFDLVYIDGYAHTGNDGQATFRGWLAKVRRGGALAGHDYDFFRWPKTFNNVNLLANSLGMTVHTTDVCEDAFASWAVFK